MAKSARQRQKDRMHAEYLKGFRLGFDRGYADGRRYGRSEIREQFRDLLGVEPRFDFVDVLPVGENAVHPNKESK